MDLAGTRLNKQNVFDHFIAAGPHGAGTPTWMRIENIADQLALLLKNLEMDL